MSSVSEHFEAIAIVPLPQAPSSPFSTCPPDALRLPPAPDFHQPESAESLVHLLTCFHLPSSAPSVHVPAPFPWSVARLSVLLCLSFQPSEPLPFTLKPVPACLPLDCLSAFDRCLSYDSVSFMCLLTLNL